MSRDLNEGKEAGLRPLEEPEAEHVPGPLVQTSKSNQTSASLGVSQCCLCLARKGAPGSRKRTKIAIKGIIRTIRGMDMGCRLDNLIVTV